MVVASAFIAAVGDPEGTRTITSIVALLAVLGIGLVMVAVWLFRSTRPDHDLLAPKFRKSAGKHAPSLTSLKKYAKAVGCKVEIRLVPQR